MLRRVNPAQRPAFTPLLGAAAGIRVQYLPDIANLRSGLHAPIFDRIHITHLGS
jgi:hypothetical protein